MHGRAWPFSLLEAAAVFLGALLEEMVAFSPAGEMVAQGRSMIELMKLFFFLNIEPCPKGIVPSEFCSCLKEAGRLS